MVFEFRKGYLIVLYMGIRPAVCTEQKMYSGVWDDESHPEACEFFCYSAVVTKDRAFSVLSFLGESVQVKNLQWWGNSTAIVGVLFSVRRINYFWPKRLCNFTNTRWISFLAKKCYFVTRANLTSFVGGELFAFGVATMALAFGVAFLKKCTFVWQKCTLQVPRPWTRYLYAL